MALYAISDLHLALSTDKPMDIFGEKWIGHDEKIRNNWIEKIKDTDTVLIAGDISWSMKHDDSKKDLDWVDDLTGKKIISKGNHDYWWCSISKLNAMYKNTKFIQNNFFTYKDYAICGTRGWICKGSERFSGKDEKIYLREEIRLRLSLEEAKRAGYEKIICMLHYPPTNEKLENSVFTSIIEEFKVEKVVYGHLHGNILKDRMLEGNHNGVEYILTSCDYIDFNPIKILD